MTENIDDVAGIISAGRHYLEGPGRPPLTDGEVFEYASRICQEKQQPEDPDPGFCKMFAILLLLDRGWEIVRFVDAGIGDAQLPLEAVYVDGPNAPPRMRLRGDPDKPLDCLSHWSIMTHERFEETQWAMLAPFLARGKPKEAWFYIFSDKVVLPWTKEERSGREGGYGWITKVEIHPSHHNFKVTDRSNGQFAIKHFKPDLHKRSGRSRSQNVGGGNVDEGGAGETENLGGLAPETLKAIRREFKREIEILNRFSGDEHPHLISLQASFRHGDEYCVIVPWAERDLKSMWRDCPNGDPLDKPNLEWMLGQCLGIASGLHKIHFYRIDGEGEEEEEEEEDSSDDEYEEEDDDDILSSRRIYGRHGDIKPENILLFRNAADAADRGRLVITDFGLSRFHSDGTKSYFPSGDVEATWTYRPPECDMEGCTISPSFDIWSLGCVLLEFVAWYLGGWELVSAFIKHRRARNPLVFGFNMDQFFEVVVDPGAVDADGPFYSRVKYEVHDVRPTSPLYLQLFKLTLPPFSVRPHQTAHPPVHLRPAPSPPRLRAHPHARRGTYHDDHDHDDHDHDGHHHQHHHRTSTAAPRPRRLHARARRAGDNLRQRKDRRSRLHTPDRVSARGGTRRAARGGAGATERVHE
jgi:serine/threonine protein kinase